MGTLAHCSGTLIHNKGIPPTIVGDLHTIENSSPPQRDTGAQYHEKSYCKEVGTESYSGLVGTKVSEANLALRAKAVWSESKATSV